MMSMEVNSNYKNDYLVRLQESKEKTKEVSKEQESKNKNADIPVLKDEYVSSGQSGSRASGLDRMVQDENGKKCTTDTDKVDREIKKLKEQKQQLEQQITAASGDEETVKELEKKLSRVEGELSQKDNDTYRRQNAVIS